MTAWNALGASELDPEKIFTSPTAYALFNNIQAFAEGNAPFQLVQAALAANAVGNAELQSGTVGQAELKTTTGTVTLAASSGGGQQDVVRTMPGGQWGRQFETRGHNYNGTGLHPQADGGVLVLPGFVDWDTSTSSAPAVTALNTTSELGYSARVRMAIRVGDTADAIYVRQRYETASKPYDLGDGECGLFIFAEMRGKEVGGLYVAHDPPWAYNGQTDIRPHWSDKNGRGWRREKRPALTIEDLHAGRCDLGELLAAKREAPTEDVEIKPEHKNADMHLHPHSWETEPEGTICLLDPMSTHELAELHDDGEDIAELIHAGYIRVGAKVKRAAPPGVTPVAVKWKRSGKR